MNKIYKKLRQNTKGLTDGGFGFINSTNSSG